MGAVQRPVKQFGFRTYTDDFNAAPLNPTPPPSHVYEIQTAEVDGDLDTLYTLVNGNLDDANAGPQAFSGSRIKNAPDGIGTAQINDQAVTTGQIGDQAVTTGKIQDIAVTTVKIAVGATTPAHVSAVFESGVGITTVEGTLVTLPAITTRGGIVHLFGMGTIEAAQLGDATETVTIKLQRDGVDLLIWDFTITGFGAQKVPIPTPSFLDDFLSGGTYVYRLRAVTSGAGITVTTPVGNQGRFFALEYA